LSIRRRQGSELDRGGGIQVSTRRNKGCQRTLPTRLRACTGSARWRPARHAFGSYSLASEAGCSRTSLPSGRLRNPTGAASMRADAGGQRRWATTAHHSRRDGSRWQVKTRLSLWCGVVTGGWLVGSNLAGVATRAEQRRGIGLRGS
jgi:hypothetical protein